MVEVVQTIELPQPAYLVTQDGEHKIVQFSMPVTLRPIFTRVKVLMTVSKRLNDEKIINLNGVSRFTINDREVIALIFMKQDVVNGVPAGRKVSVQFLNDKYEPDAQTKLNAVYFYDSDDALLSVQKFPDEN